ncbi:hypothetical protein KAU11_03030, partial [Candidatus Babeliales bacterium]|nr:hypothetical protein [Candidatus Babeliales bacterium]
MLKKTFFLFLIGFITIFVSQERVSAIIWSNLVKTRVGQISLATVGVGIVGFGVDCALETKKRLSRYPRKTKWQAFKTALKSGGELRIPSILTILVGSVFGFKNLMKKVKNDNGNLSGQSTADIGSETEGPEAGASQEISSEEQNSSGSNEDSIENKPLDKLNNVGDLDAATRKKLFENVNTNDGDRKKYKFSCQMCLEEHRCVEHMKICDQCWMPCCSGCAVHWGETSVSGETCPNCRGKNM